MTLQIMANKILDPLAQSFILTEPTVITKTGLFFLSKDENLPAFVQIRKNVNGFPGNYIVPLSHVIVYPSDVSASDDGSEETIVNFQGPIYLEAGEYSLILGSDSKNYKVWVSELDGIDVLTSKRITEQPYVGSLFKSQNTSTWTPVQTEDLKFKIYRAVFDTSATASVQFTVNNPYSYRQLQYDPLEVYPTSTTMKVYHLNHGMSTGSYVTLSGLPDSSVMTGNTVYYYGLTPSQINGQTFPISNVTLATYTVDLPQAVDANVTSITRFGGAGIMASQDVQFETVYPAIAAVTQGTSNLIHSFKSTGTDYTFDSSFTRLIDNDNELPSTKLVAGLVSKQNSMSNATSLVYQLNFTTDNDRVAPLVDTKMSSIVLTKNLVDNPSYSTQNLTQDIVTIATAATNAFVTKQSNSIGLLSLTTASHVLAAKSIVNGTYVTLSGNTINAGQYRVLDVLDSGANIKLSKLSGTVVSEPAGNTFTVVNGTKFIAEEAATGGSAYSKYITRQVDFVNPSTSFNLRLDVVQPANSYVKLYYKTKLVGETEILANKEYTEITGVTIPTSLNGEFYEVETQLDGLPQFNAIVLKVVFLSDNAAFVPKISNLRLIALA